MIALFDSGYGGLTVLKPILELLPEYEYAYLGDNERYPYGIHSDEVIKEYSEQAVEFLLKQGAKLIIFACNTASSSALRHIQKKFKNDKILGVLIPTAEEAVETTKNLSIGVVGTKTTINSNSYEKEIHKLNPKIKVVQKACPLLIPLIEEGWHNKPEAISILKKYLKPLKTHNLDTLILGCTHFPLMQKHFKRIMGKRTKILSSGEITAKKLKEYLFRHPEIEKKLKKGKTRKFFTTSDPKTFQDYVQKHFGMKIAPPHHCTLNIVN